MGIYFIPAKNSFSEIGIEFKVASSEYLNPIRTANIQLLIQARNAMNQVTDEITEKVNKSFDDRAWMTLFDLSAKIKCIDITVLLQMINQGKLYCLIDDELLSKPETTWVSIHKDALQISYEARLKNDNHLLAGMNVEDMECKFVPTIKQAMKALEILKRIESGEKGRSIRRYKNKIEEGGKNGLTPYQSVLPKTHKNGNRTERINPICVSHIHKFIKNTYPEFKKSGEKKAYAKYRNTAIKEHPAHPPVSYSTFRKYCKLANQQKIAYGEGGIRKENSVVSPSEIEDRDIQVTLPFEKASMDHGLSKIKLILAESNGVVYTARPWVSALVDIKTKEILSIWVSFKNPSVRSCGLVIRQCVRKHGRLPSGIVLDRGSDFKSVYFNSLLANYSVAPIMRPTAHCRYGSEVERFFLEFKTQWLNMRPGSFSSVSYSRSVSSSHTPDEDEIMTIEKFIDELNQFLDWRSATIIGGQSVPPGKFFKDKSTQYSCVGAKVAVDDAFIIATAVDTKKYTIDPVRGIHINDVRYWHSDLKKLANLGKKVEVRIELEDPYRVYANIDNKWVTCYGRGETTFHTYDPITRLAESLRVLEGRNIRDKAKDYAEEILIEKIDLANENLGEQRNIFSESESKSKEGVSQKESLFSKLKKIKKKKLKMTDWEGA